MEIKDYKFKVGDEVITIKGVRGFIDRICECSECQRRGFYEPVWSYHEGNELSGEWYEDYISATDAILGFPGYYKIGEYRFHDFDKAYILSQMASHEKEYQRLRKQFKLIEELESKE